MVAQALLRGGLSVAFGKGSRDCACACPTCWSIVCPTPRRAGLRGWAILSIDTQLFQEAHMRFAALFRTVAFSLLFCLPTLTARSQSRLIASGGTTTPHAAPLGLNADGQIEIDSAMSGNTDAGNNAVGFTSVNRKMGDGRKGQDARAEKRGEPAAHNA